MVTIGTQTRKVLKGRKDEAEKEGFQGSREALRYKFQSIEARSYVKGNH